MSAGPLSYDEMLSELQALAGRRVFVAVRIEVDGEEQPLAMLCGVLSYGPMADLSVIPEEPPVETPFPAGESVLLSVSGDGSLPLASFFITRSTYHLGEKREHDGALTFSAGSAVTTVAPTD